MGRDETIFLWHGEIILSYKKCRVKAQPFSGCGGDGTRERVVVKHQIPP